MSNTGFVVGEHTYGLQDNTLLEYLGHVYDVEAQRYKFLFKKIFIRQTFGEWIEPQHYAKFISLGKGSLKQLEPLVKTQPDERLPLPKGFARA